MDLPGYLDRHPEAAKTTVRNAGQRSIRCRRGCCVDQPVDARKGLAQGLITPGNPLGVLANLHSQRRSASAERSQERHSELLIADDDGHLAPVAAEPFILERHQFLSAKQARQRRRLIALTVRQLIQHARKIGIAEAINHTNGLPAAFVHLMSPRERKQHSFGHGEAWRCCASR